ncbi:MAG TPA: SDR family NAD(P)-dependent oxidoreductase [Planctomycetota bacterium]|nr:SDR family NAD(P)-dependent oxidoreductase [Planctomycetota bacterium]
MAIPLDMERFRFGPEASSGVRGKRFLITGAGKHGGLGQAFAFGAGLNGAASVGIHFHRSYNDGLETVEAIEKAGGAAFPVQADVTNPGDVWATRGHVIRQLGEQLPDVLICNSGLSERGYLLGRAPKEVEGESVALRRARARQAFVDNLADTRDVVDTKLDGFLNMTHLWAGEATHAKRPLQIVYVSSRQALDPGAGVPGYVAANWAVLALPKILQVNLGKSADLVTSFSIALPFVRTGMTAEYAENPKVFGRWQPRMLEPHEAALALLELLARPAADVTGRTFELNVAADEAAGPGGVAVTWAEARLSFERAPLEWSAAKPLRFAPPPAQT